MKYRGGTWVLDLDPYEPEFEPNFYEPILCPTLTKTKNISAMHGPPQPPIIHLIPSNIHWPEYH